MVIFQELARLYQLRHVQEGEGKMEILRLLNLLNERSGKLVEEILKGVSLLLKLGEL